MRGSRLAMAARDQSGPAFRRCDQRARSTWPDDKARSLMAVIAVGQQIGFIVASIRWLTTMLREGPRHGDEYRYGA